MSTPTPDDAASDSVIITYEVDGEIITKKIELLVIACDPRNLLGICDYGPAEKYVFDKFTNFTMHTSLLKVKNNPKSEFAVIFSPDALESMDGGLYAFRNETVKTFGFAAANAMPENLVTVYQLNAKPWSQSQFVSYLKHQLQTIKWWPYGRTWGKDYELEETFTTPYFDHFSIDALKADGSLPWQFLKLQGARKTIYAHASTCLESVLQCWQYANMLLDPNNNFGVKLPERRDAAIVILGAGASGVLFANRLRDLHYTNVEILELTDRSDGKINDVVKHDPHPPGNRQPTYCALGCCYLSPAYDEFVKYLAPFLSGNERIPLSSGDDTDHFRAVVTTGQFDRWGPTVPYVMNFNRYVLQKAKYELKYSADYADWKIDLEMLAFLEGYIKLYPFYMGDTVPMPPQQPTNFDQFALKTYHQFLADDGLIALVGALQYGYSVQGYGALDQISAYYGLIWVPPTVIQGMIDGGITGAPVVTAWSKGWGNIWEQMKAGMKITYNVTTKKIARPA